MPLIRLEATLLAIYEKELGLFGNDPSLSIAATLTRVGSGELG